MSDPCLSPRLRDADLADRLAVDGFCTVPMLDAEAVRGLAVLFDTLFDRPRQGFLSSVLQPPAIRRAAHDAILPFVAEALAAHVRDFRIALCSFVARYPGSDQSDLPLHQDWSFVDERTARSVSIWIPLQAVDAANGCLTVVPGSHRHDQPPRAIGSGFRYRSLEPMLRADHLVDVPMASGEAAFFDHRLIHGSRSNAGATPRLAVGAVLVPRGARLAVGVPRPSGDRFGTVPDSFLLDADLVGLISGRHRAQGEGRRSHAVACSAEAPID